MDFQFIFKHIDDQAQLKILLETKSWALFPRLEFIEEAVSVCSTMVLVQFFSTQYINKKILKKFLDIHGKYNVGFPFPEAGAMQRGDVRDIKIMIRKQRHLETFEVTSMIVDLVNEQCTPDSLAFMFLDQRRRGLSPCPSRSKLNIGLRKYSTHCVLFDENEVNLTTLLEDRVSTRGVRRAYPIYPTLKLLKQFILEDRNLVKLNLGLFYIKDKDVMLYILNEFKDDSSRFKLMNSRFCELKSLILLDRSLRLDLSFFRVGGFNHKHSKLVKIDPSFNFKLFKDIEKPCIYIRTDIFNNKRQPAILDYEASDYFKEIWNVKGLKLRKVLFEKAISYRKLVRDKAWKKSTYKKMEKEVAIINVFYLYLVDFCAINNIGYSTTIDLISKIELPDSSDARIYYFVLHLAEYVKNKLKLLRVFNYKTDQGNVRDTLRMLKLLKYSPLNLDFSNVYDLHSKVIDIFKVNKRIVKQLDLSQELDLPEKLVGLTTRIPKTSHDLHLLGQDLNNCVGSYSSRVARKISSVFYLEKESKPYICIEIKGSRIVQCRKKGNRPVDITLMSKITKELKKHQNRD